MVVDFSNPCCFTRFPIEDLELVCFNALIEVSICKTDMVHFTYTTFVMIYHTLFVYDLGFGSLVLRMLQPFIVLKTGCIATPILERRLCNCLLVFSVVFWSTKGKENMTLGRLSLLLSIVLLCPLHNW